MSLMRVNPEKFSLRRLYWIFIFYAFEHSTETTDKSGAEMKILGL